MEPLRRLPFPGTNTPGAGEKVPTPLSTSPPMGWAQGGRLEPLRRLPFPGTETPGLGADSAAATSIPGSSAPAWMSYLDRTRPDPATSTTDQQGPMLGPSRAPIPSFQNPTGQRAPTGPSHTRTPIPLMEGRIPWVRIKDLGNQGIPNLVFLKPNKSAPFGYVPYQGPMPDQTDIVEVKTNLLPKFLQRRK